MAPIGTVETEDPGMDAEAKSAKSQIILRMRDLARVKQFDEDGKLVREHPGRTGYSRQWIYKQITKGLFPKPDVRLGPRSVGWYDSTIAKHQKKQAAEARQRGA